MVLVTRHLFGLPWHETLRGAWLVLRANQLWAPQTDNDPDGARRAMERFYALVKREHDERYDPRVAAGLEVEWWRIHREHQRSGSGLDERTLVDALARLYSYAYAAPETSVRQAAEQRALAMDLSDAGSGRAATSPARWSTMSERRSCARMRRSWPPCICPELWFRGPIDSRSRVSLPDQVRGPLADHERRHDRVGGRHRREDRAVGDRETLDTADAQLGVHNS